MKPPRTPGKGNVKNLLREFPYWDVDDGVMVLTDGACEAGLTTTLLPELSDASVGQITAMLKATLRATPPGSRIRFTTTVGPCNEELLNTYCGLTDAQEPVAKHLTEVRHGFLESQRRAGYLTRWDSTISVCLKPSVKPRKKQLNALATLDLEDREAAVKRVCAGIERYLDQVGFKPRRMTTQDVFEHVYRYLNPGSDQVALGPYRPTHQRYPSQAVERFEGLRPPTLAAQLAKTPIDNTRPGHLLVGETYIKMLALHTEPDEVFPTLGNLLLGSSVDCTVIVEMKHEEQGETLRGIKGTNQRNGASAAVPGMYVDSDQAENLQQGRALLSYLTRTGEHVFQTGAVLVLRSKDLAELSYVADLALSRLAQVPGTPFRQLFQGVKGPWTAVAPFNGRRYEEFVSLVESHAAYFVPVHGPYQGGKKPLALFHTRHNTLAGFDTFDPRTKNKHALFLGGTRSGKTFTAQYIAQQHLRDASVDLRVIDRGLSWERLTRSFGGVVIPVEAGGSVTVNMFDLEPDQTRPGAYQKAFLLNVLRAMVPSEKVAARDENAVLTYAIEQAYENARTQVEVEVNGELTWIEEFEPFYLSDFKRTLKSLSSIGDQPLSQTERDVADALARGLETWCGNTPLGRFVDGPTTLATSEARVVLYETSGFDNQPQLDVVGTMLIQNEIWKRARRSKQRKMILATDEAWAMTQNPHSCAFLVEIARRGAKEGISLWLLTHSIADVSGEGKDGLLGMSTFFLFRVNNEEDRIAQSLGLSAPVLADYKTLRGQKGCLQRVLSVRQT